MSRNITDFRITVAKQIAAGWRSTLMRIPDASFDHRRWKTTMDAHLPSLSIQSPHRHKAEQTEKARTVFDTGRDD